MKRQIAAYHAQQAIEKILKSEIYKVAPDISPRKMYTHKIYDLYAIAESYGIKVPITAAVHHFLHEYDYNYVVFIQGLFADSRACAVAEERRFGK